MFKYRLQLIFRMLVVTLLCILSPQSFIDSEELKSIDQKILLRIYLSICQEELDELKRILTSRNTAVAGTHELASRSAIFEREPCDSESDEGLQRIRRLEWLDATEKYVRKNGIERYVTMMKKSLSDALREYNYDSFVQEMYNKSISPTELEILFLLHKAKAFNRAHIFYFTKK